MNTPRDVTHVTFSDIGCPFVSVFPVSSLQFLNPGIRSRAARDTCAPRAMIRRLVNRNPLTLQGLQSRAPRGAQGSRDTSAALQLSNDFSFFSIWATCPEPRRRVHPEFNISSLKSPVSDPWYAPTRHRHLHSTGKSAASRIPYKLRTIENAALFVFLSLRARRKGWPGRG